MLTNDERVIAGVPCTVRIVAMHKPDRDDRGRIEVEYVGRAVSRRLNFRILAAAVW